MIHVALHLNGFITPSNCTITSSFLSLAELEEMRTELHKVRCHSARLREEICTVKGQLGGERSKQERTRKELEELKSMHHALLKQSKNERLHFELKIKELKKENVTLKTELAQEKDDKEMFSSEVKRLQDLCDAMHENLKTQEKDMSELKKQHRNTVEENDKFIGQLGKFSVDIEHVFDRKESTGGRKRHSREETIPSFIGIASEMSINCADSDENKENLECLTGNRGDLVESLNGTSPLEAKREIEELISKTLKEKDEAVARCMELELLLQKAQVRQLEMKRKTSLRDRGTSFGDVPEDMNGQGEGKASLNKRNIIHFHLFSFSILLAHVLTPLNYSAICFCCKVIIEHSYAKPAAQPIQILILIPCPIDSKEI